MEKLTHIVFCQAQRDRLFKHQCFKSKGSIHQGSESIIQVWTKVFTLSAVWSEQNKKKELTKKLFLFQSPESLQITMIDLFFFRRFCRFRPFKTMLNFMFNLIFSNCWGEPSSGDNQCSHSHLYTNHKLDVRRRHLECVYFYRVRFCLNRNQVSLELNTHTSNIENQTSSTLELKKSELEKVLFSPSLSVFV